VVSGKPSLAYSAGTHFSRPNNSEVVEKPAAPTKRADFLRLNGTIETVPVPSLLEPRFPQPPQMRRARHLDQWFAKRQSSAASVRSAMLIPPDRIHTLFLLCRTM
jgi:hypothetical protein